MKELDVLVYYIYDEYHGHKFFKELNEAVNCLKKHGYSAKDVLENSPVIAVFENGSEKVTNLKQFIYKKRISKKDKQNIEEEIERMIIQQEKEEAEFRRAIESGESYSPITGFATTFSRKDKAFLIKREMDELRHCWR